MNVSADMFLGMLMNSSSWTHRRELKAQYLTFPRWLGTLRAVLRVAAAFSSLMESPILWVVVIQDVLRMGSTTTA